MRYYLKFKGVVRIKHTCCLLYGAETLLELDKLYDLL